MRMKKTGEQNKIGEKFFFVCNHTFNAYMEECCYIRSGNPHVSKL